MTRWSSSFGENRPSKNWRWCSRRSGRCAPCWARICARSILSGRSSKSPLRSPGDGRLQQVDLLRYIVDVLEKDRIDYMLVGSFASSLYGQPRITNDIDIVVEL